MIHNRKNPYLATLASRTPLTKTGSTKSTYHIVLQIDGENFPYKAGDSIGCFPVNCPNLIEQICGYFPSESLDPPFVEHLRKNINIFSGTKKLLALIEKNLPIGEKQKQLSNILSDQSTCQSFLKQTPILEIFRAYPAKIPKDAFIETLRPQLPRFYSIASSSLMHPEQIHLTVSEVQFQIDGRTYYGAASKFLCSDLQIGDPISIYVQPTLHFTLPDPESSIIMIGPGTGIAPFRAFLQERQVKQATGKNWLFFGERHKTFDFYYQDYFEELAQNRFLKLDTAFSRDGKEKIYVQHKLKEHAKELFEWIENGAYLYVCGDAKHMAKDVEETLVEIIQKNKNVDRLGAREYLKALRKEKRYLTDVY